MQKTKYITAQGYLVVNKKLLLHVIVVSQYNGAQFNNMLFQILSILTTHMVVLMQFQQNDDTREKNR